MRIAEGGVGDQQSFLLQGPVREFFWTEFKQQLARDHRHDNIGYMRGKDPFIRALLEEARQWSRAALATRRDDV